MASPVRVQFSRDCALRDIEETFAEWGDCAVFKLNTDSTIGQDIYNSIKSKNAPSKTISVNCMPIFSPEKRDYQKAGIREQSDVLLHTSTKQWSDQTPSITFDEIDIIRTFAELGNGTYTIVEKNEVGQVGDGYIYITFGLKKK